MKFIKARYSLEFKNDITEEAANIIIGDVLGKIEDSVDVDCLYGMVKGNKKCWIAILTIQESTYKECRAVLSLARRKLKSSLKELHCNVSEDVVIEGERI